MTFAIVDGNNLLHRSMHGPAYAREDGQEVGGAISFASTLGRLLLEQRATHVACVFDGPGRSFRRLMADSYKGERERDAPSEGDIWQRRAMQETTRAIGAHPVMSAPYEADDVIATLALRYVPRGRVVILSDDKDLQTLTAEGVVIRRFRDDHDLRPAEVRQRWRVDPRLIPSVQAIGGDGGDGVAGMRGVGSTSAARALAECGSLESVLVGIPAWAGARWMEWSGWASGARRCRDAVTLVRDAVTDARPQRLPDDWPHRLAGVLVDLGSRRVLREFCTRARIDPERVRPLACIGREPQAAVPVTLD